MVLVMSERLRIVDGRRFGCTRCGNCCVQPGYVFFSWPELDRMATHLDLDVTEFRARFGVTWDAQLGCWSIDATDGRGCSLLDADRGCRVHPVKPTQCKTFPFWPELVDEAEGWEAAKAYCPGLDRAEGRLYSADEIRRIRDTAES